MPTLLKVSSQNKTIKIKIIMPLLSSALLEAHIKGKNHGYIYFIWQKQYCSECCFPRKCKPLIPLKIVNYQPWVSFDIFYGVKKSSDLLQTKKDYIQLSQRQINLLARDNNVKYGQPYPNTKWNSLYQFVILS